MVTAESGMNFSQELPPLFLGYTSLKDSGGAFLVELSLVNFIGLRTLDDAARLVLIFWEILPIKVGQERFGPWGNDCHDEMRRWCYVDVSGIWVMFGSGLALPFSTCHTTDGLKSLSRKILGGTGSRLAPI